MYSNTCVSSVYVRWGVSLPVLCVAASDARSTAKGWRDSFLLNGIRVGSVRIAWRFTPQNRGSTIRTGDHDTTLTQIGRNLVLRPVSLGYPSRENCELAFRDGEAIINQTSVAAGVGYWIAQPAASPRPSVRCADGFASSWPFTL
eukprot:COSAG05_NODE_1968_length_3768_cov_11.358408_3_plen_145_part_00